MEKFFGREPALGREFILFVLKKSVSLLHQVRVQLAGYDNINWDAEPGKSAVASGNTEGIPAPNPLSLIRHSPFFRGLPGKNPPQARKRRPEKILHQQRRHIHLGRGLEGNGPSLAYGKAALCFTPDSDAGIDESVALHLIDKQGYLVGWTGRVPGKTNDVMAVASRDSVVYHISGRSLDRIMNRDPALALQFAKRLLWLISIRLRNARAGLISQTYEREILAISNLI